MKTNYLADWIDGGAAKNLAAAAFRGTTRNRSRRATAREVYQ